MIEILSYVARSKTVTKKNREKIIGQLSESYMFTIEYLQDVWDTFFLLLKKNIYIGRISWYEKAILFVAYYSREVDFSKLNMKLEKSLLNILHSTTKH